jgi:hypothetical protein
MRNVRARFWIEAGLAELSGCLLIITLVWRDWLEIVFGIDPDNASGGLEWLISLAMLAIAVVLSVLARLEWRRRSSRAGAALRTLST